MKKIVLGLSASILLCNVLYGDEAAFSQYAIALKGGSLGGGIELTTNLTKSINTRLSITGFTYDSDETDTDISYEADLKILNVALLADYYISNNSQFRFTAGAMYNRNQFDMTGTPNNAGTYEINGRVYTVAEVGSVDASIDFNKVAPYIGIGWGNAVQTAGWNFTADIGVMFQGTANVDLSVNTTLTGALKTELDTNVAQEQKELENDLSDFKSYPVVSLGVSYRF